MRILVTNDDGIDGAGLHVLARRLTALGDVVVVAPDREYSGASAALGALHIIRPEVRPAKIEGVAEAWSISGPPALCVTFARLGLFGGSFDLVAAGINPGANTGRAIYHSGTVGAAITARNGGIPGLAVSQDVAGDDVEGQGYGDQILGQKWDTAAEVAARVAEAMLDDPGDEAAVINVNVPNLEVDELVGWKRATIAHMPTRAILNASLVPKPGHDEVYDVKMDWGDPVDLPPETDSGAVENGFVTLSAITRITEDPSVDLSAVTAKLDQVLG
ncbi:MAG: 5'/3'-nucleotidase SurE [Acidimicrobiales bacterium]|nr:5'/3'-nucleotidase SurE [Acidimicrobiales bacterium]